jgi:chromosome segregation ATPase
LSRSNEDLKQEQITAHNNNSALQSALDRYRSQELETRSLENHLDAISRQSDEYNAQTRALQQEKDSLKQRVQELEREREASNETQSFAPRRKSGIPTRNRSSSVSNAATIGAGTLESELNGVKLALQQKMAEAQEKDHKLSSMQSQLILLGNEKVALEKRSSSQLSDLQSKVDDLQEEVEFLRATQDDGSREEELLKRIEEDDAKIEALEMLIRNSSDTKKVEAELRAARDQLKEEAQKLDDCEFRNIELINEKEEIQEEFDMTQKEVTLLKALIEDREMQISM